MIIVYGSEFDEYLAAVYDGFYSRKKEIEILSEDRATGSLFETLHTEKNEEKSRKVYEAVCSKLSHNTAEIIYKAWLSRGETIDTDIFVFLKFAFRQGRDVTQMLQNPKVKKVVEAANAVGAQAHKFLGLLRFGKIGEIYVADFKPDYDLLPLVAPHFKDRFRTLPFAIRDLKHKKMLVHEGGESPRTAVVKLESAEQITGTDDSFEEMWKEYYKSMTIKERINPNYKLRQQFMPKKFWNNICELKEER